ncbi:MAG: hypothetical protein ACKOI3_07510 [Actinomycetota bacterium]
MGLGEFVGGVLGEILCAQCLNGRETQRHVRLFFVTGSVARVVTVVDGECHRLFADGIGIFAGRQVIPEHGEGDVECLAIFGASHHGGVCGPIHTVAIRDADGIEALHECDHRVERHTQPRAAQHPPEGDGHAFGSH